MDLKSGVIRGVDFIGSGLFKRRTIILLILHVYTASGGGIEIKLKKKNYILLNF